MSVQPYLHRLQYFQQQTPSILYLSSFLYGSQEGQFVCTLSQIAKCELTNVQPIECVLDLQIVGLQVADAVQTQKFPFFGLHRI